ncbi:hypothetical protein [Erwinia phage Snitter]|nr:hypothetical protein [Erwinia phage Snitter]
MSNWNLAKVLFLLSAVIDFRPRRFSNKKVVRKRL